MNNAEINEDFLKFKEFLFQQEKMTRSYLQVIDQKAFSDNPAMDQLFTQIYFDSLKLSMTIHEVIKLYEKEHH